SLSSSLGLSYGALIELRPAVPPMVTPPGALVIPKPAGTVTGDVMVASIAVTRDNNTNSLGISNPPGWSLWSLVNQQNQGSNNTRSQLATYYRVATGSEPTHYAWSFSGSQH